MFYEDHYVQTPPMDCVCTNCGGPCTAGICGMCLQRQQCTVCCRYLPEHCFISDALCRACNNKKNKPTIHTALDETAIEIEIPTCESDVDFTSFVERNGDAILEQIEHMRQLHGSILAGVTTDTTFTRDVEGHFSRIPAYFHVLPQIVTRGQHFDLDIMLEKLEKKVDAFTARGSGFTLERIHRFVLCVTPYRPLVGSTYIPTPKFLADKRCLVNVRSSDEKCFVWAILSALYEPERDKERVWQYNKYENVLNLEGLSFPMQIKQVSKFEDMNQDISINVLYFERDTRDFSIEYKSPHVGRKHQVNLLLLDEENTSKRHYVRITNMSRLVAHRTNHQHTTHVCISCLHPFRTKTALDNHTPYCSRYDPQQIRYPDEGDSTLQFHSRDKQHKVPFLLVSDFETFTPPVQDDRECNTKIVNSHQVSGFCVYRVTQYAQYQTPPFVYSGPNPMSKFYDHIMNESQIISDILSKQMDMLPLTKEEKENFRAATHCECCEEAFTVANPKVRHHDHISGQYLFATCNNCNLQLKPKKFAKKTGDKRQRNQANDFFLPVLFHNGGGFDYHFVIKHVQRKYLERQKADQKVTIDDVNVIPQNSEKYLMFQIGHLRFLDSFQFLSTSLEQLVSLLHKSGKQNFVHTAKHMDADDEDTFAKGIFPYSFMTDRQKFEETQLSPIEAFHDNLKDEPLDEKDYERAQRVWTRYGMKTMQDYHDHYLLMDVLLLADVFENFRRSVMERHKLDCLHFVTLPSLAWAMALKHTDAKLDLITDPDIYLTIEGGMRGGIATISKRHAAANNPDVEGYDPTQPNRYITYLDANSLYATAQSQPLPVGDFRILTEQEMRDFDLDSIAADAPTGYILECDLQYPEHLHDHHNDYPMAAEHLTVTKDMLSPYAESLMSPNRSWVPTRKLVPNLLDKHKYVVHYRNLQLYKKHGLIITKIHKIISFTQSAWLKPWIELCNEQRKSAKSDFESDLAKLQANATFGKTMENVRNRENIRLIADPNKLLKAVSKVTFRQSQIVNPELVMVRAARKKVTLNKPIAVGFSILEISKFIMYQFYYEHLKAKYGYRCMLLFTDTDSLCCEIETDDLHRDMGEHLDLYDTSNFSPDHPQYSRANHRVLGKMKSETGSVQPSEFVGLRAKMYSLKAPGKCHKKAKGIQKHYVRKHVRHEQFLNVLRKTTAHTKATFRTFRSTNHVINTVELTKLCLSAFDDKRYILDDGVCTLAYGHKSLRK